MKCFIWHWGNERRSCLAYYSTYCSTCLAYSSTNIGFRRFTANTRRGFSSSIWGCKIRSWTTSKESTKLWWNNMTALGNSWYSNISSSRSIGTWWRITEHISCIGLWRIEISRRIKSRTNCSRSVRKCRRSKIDGFSKRRKLWWFWTSI